MKQELRPDQAKVIADVEAVMRAGKRRVVVRAPTGYGKTTLIANLSERAQKLGSTLWVIVHRAELARQAAERLEGQGVSAGIIKASSSSSPTALAQVVSVDTIAARLRRRDDGAIFADADLPPPPKLAFVDEAHHITASSWQRVMDYLGPAHVIGLSATPWGAHGAGLPFFEAIVEGPHPRELIGPGLPLVDADIYVGPAPQLADVGVVGGDFNQGELDLASSRIVGDVVETWRKRAAGKRTICFAVSKRHSNDLVDAWLAAGVPAAHVDDTTDDDDRKRIFDQLRRGEILVVSNVGIVTEGFDAPAVEACVLARATKSERLYLQAVGRALRASPGKERAIVLDHGNNALRHGHPFALRVATLADGRPKQKRVSEEKIAAGDVETFRLCPRCLICCATGALQCHKCGHQFGKIPTADTTKDLVLLVGEPGPSKAMKEQERRKFWFAIKGKMPTKQATSLYEKKYGISPFKDTILKRRRA